MSHLPIQDIKSIIGQIDESLDCMAGILEEELRKLQRSFDEHLRRIERVEMRADRSLAPKLRDARDVFQQAKINALAINDLLEPLRNIKQVNKMIRFSLQDQGGQALINIAAYTDAIANICLGQLKCIRARYDDILQRIKNDITRLWMDRELSQCLQMILSVNHLQFNKFMAAFHHAEVLYADASLAIRSTSDEDLHHRIVLRMVSNRLPSEQEQKIINTLFPAWDADNDLSA